MHIDGSGAALETAGSLARRNSFGLIYRVNYEYLLFIELLSAFHVQGSDCHYSILMSALQSL